MEQSKLPDLDTAGEETRPSVAEEQEGIGKLTPNDPMRWRRRLPPLRPDPGKERHIGGADDSPWWQTGLPGEGLRDTIQRKVSASRDHSVEIGAERDPWSAKTFSEPLRCLGTREIE